MPRLFEGTEITTEPDSDHRFAFGKTATAGSSIWTWANFKTWLSTNAGVAVDNKLTWETNPFEGIKIKGSMDKYGGAFSIEIVLEMGFLVVQRVVDLFPSVLDGCIVRYEIAEHGLITDIDGGLAGMNYTVLAFEYDGSDWTSSATTWGNSKGNCYMHSNNLDDSGTYLSGTSKLSLAEDAKLVVNFPTSVGGAGATKGAINLTGYIRGYGDV